MDEPPNIITHQPDRSGSQDGTGAGDHDQPFNGFRAYQFNTHELARMLQLRSELLEAKLGRGRWSDDLAQ
jgi:hypothetical protein